MTWDTSADDLILNDATLFIDQDLNLESIKIDSESTTYNVLDIRADALTTGSALYVASDSDSGSGRKLVQIINNNIAATDTTCLTLTQDSTTWAARIKSTHSSTGHGLYVAAGNDNSTPAFRVADYGDNDKFTIQGSGNVSIGTMSPAEKLTVNDGDILVSSGRGVRANGGQEMIRFNSSDGVLINSGNSLRMQFYRSGEVDLQGVYGENVGSGAGTRAVRISSGGRVGVDTSSKRFKTNISDIKNTNWIQDLRVVDFVWKKDNSKDWGLIAEEVEKIKPELVSMDDDGKPFSVHYDKLTVLLLKQIQELTAKVEALENA